ncbi:MAG: hypothetical protein LBF71_05450 [Campylobacteraceae bacterium]|jgi:hypothetical protein|nr:hypothetical protein [Campylobacteraceae bacterium]
MKLYGASKDSNDKKLSRITVSLGYEDMELIEEIADAKNISNSEVINLLIRPTIRLIKEQEALIKENPKAVAFDLVTKV